MRGKVDTHIPGVHLCMSWSRSSMTHTFKNFSGDSDYRV